MSVRAKFKCSGYTSTLQNEQEMRSVKFAPVYANNDPEHENSKFWKYTPMGSIELGTINPEAWKQFEIGKEYYVDFTPAE